MSDQSDELAPLLCAAAEFFAEEALAFAAALEEGEFEPMPPADAVRLFGLRLFQFGVRLCQIAQARAEPPVAGAVAVVPHRGPVS